MELSQSHCLEPFGYWEKSYCPRGAPMPGYPSERCWCDEAGSSLPSSLFAFRLGESTRGASGLGVHSVVLACRDICWINLIPPGVQEEMHLLDNNVVLDRAGFSWPCSYGSGPRPSSCFSVCTPHGLAKRVLRLRGVILFGPERTLMSFKISTTLCLRGIGNSARSMPSVLRVLLLFGQRW
ncbi:hypothetical protein Tco_1133714 [Tanacetum coccineum]